MIIKARVVRHKGSNFRAAPLARHLTYLKRDGVDRKGSEGRLFDRGGDSANGERFAERCEDDRHHFRFIVSPEDAADMDDLRVFTREMMEDMANDLGTRLDWVFIEFPESVAQGELPPLFVVGTKGEAELVNYRVSGRYMIVDRLFGKAELRLGGRKGQDKVRIVAGRRGRA